MATTEITNNAAPVRVNYYYSTIERPTEAYSDASDKYAEFPFAAQVAFYDGMSFTGISSDAAIVGFKVILKACVYSASSSRPGLIDFRLVTDYHNGSTTNSSYDFYTSISANLHEILNSTAPDLTWRDYEFADTDSSSAEAVWLNNNFSKIQSGTQLAIRLRGRNTRVKSLKMALYYQLPDSSKIYVATAQAKAIYVGGTKAKAVYLGSTKIL